MAERYLRCGREQPYLMPASLRDWLPEDHFAWFVLEAVELLDLSAFHAAYRDDGWGRRAYDPALLLALLLYAYCEGERSSRRIQRRCPEDVAFRVLSANRQPDHATICRFRRRHEQALAGLFVEVLRLCAEAGLVRAGLLALDGTKLRANASRERNRMQAQLEAEVERMLAEAERTDSRVVRDYWGHYQGYNVQAVATREQVIVAAELTRAATDVQELQPMVEPTNHNLQALGQAPIGILLADAGYYSDANVGALAEAGPELLIARRNDRNRRAAGPAPRGRIPAELSARADAAPADDQARPTAVRAAPLDDRAGLRRHPREPRRPPLPAPRLRGLRRRVETDRRQPKPAQALPPPAAPSLARAVRSPLTAASPTRSPPTSDRTGPTSNRPFPMPKDILHRTTPQPLTTTTTNAKLYATASARWQFPQRHFSVRSRWGHQTGQNQEPSS